jgi:hypothetical protein
VRTTTAVRGGRGRLDDSERLGKEGIGRWRITCAEETEGNGQESAYSLICSRTT